jgi:hypothetical protein
MRRHLAPPGPPSRRRTEWGVAPSQGVVYFSPGEAIRGCRRQSRPQQGRIWLEPLRGTARVWVPSIATELETPGKGLRACQKLRPRKEAGAKIVVRHAKALPGRGWGKRTLIIRPSPYHRRLTLSSVLSTLATVSIRSALLPNSLAKSWRAAASPLGWTCAAGCGRVGSLALTCAWKAFGTEHILHGSGFPVLLSFETDARTFAWIRDVGLPQADVEQILERTAPSILPLG